MPFQNPDNGLKMLKEGNDRFAKGEMVNHTFAQESRESSQNVQRPFAIIVTCSDSRVSPELIFDQSLGQIFVVRVAGNVVTAAVQDSVNYAVLVLKASLIIVLGHESCGAVTAVVTKQTDGIPTIAEWIQGGLTKNIALEEAIKENVNHGLSVIRSAPALQPLINDRKLKIVGGYYSLKDGKVTFFKNHLKI